MQATNPVVHQPDRLGQGRLLRRPEVSYHLRTETIVAEEDVADRSSGVAQILTSLHTRDMVRPDTLVAGLGLFHVLRGLLVGR